ncbi:P-loop containing nucleoside triphosphate hydrolase protein [Atractiella rhizophila]|nr:P-loop containing nucleoside triphosphate hydrolase protein [Atractiella rhizophila]
MTSKLFVPLSICNILLLGRPRSGREALQRRFCLDYFDLDTPTGDDSFRRMLTFDSDCGNVEERCIVDLLKLTLDDFMFVVSYIQMRSVDDPGWVRALFEKVDGCVFVYDITDRESFQFVQLAHQYFIQVKNVDWAPAVLVGTKEDLIGLRELEYSEGKELAKILACPFFEVSALTGDGVEAAFLELVTEIRRHTHRPVSMRQTPRKRKQLFHFN